MALGVLTPVERRSKRSWLDAVRVAFAVTFVLAAAIRLTGVYGILPYIHHPDEPKNELIALRVAHAPLKSPGFFNYPSLLFYAQAAVIGVDETFTGHRVLPAEVVSHANARAQESLHLALGRGLTALIGAATAVVAQALVLEAGAPVAVACIAGLAVALSPPLVEHGRYITPDAYAAFFAMLVLLFACRIARGAAITQYVLAGAAVGLAAGCKYNLALVAMAVIVAHLRRVGPRYFLDTRLLAAGGAAMLAFVASTPFAVLDHSTFVKGITFEAKHYKKGHAGSEGGSLAFYLKILWQACGPWALLSFAAFSKRRNAAFVVLPFAVAYLVFLSSFIVHFDRNAVPLGAPLIGMGVLGAWDIARRTAERTSRANPERLATAVVAALALAVAAAGAPAVLRELHELRTNHRASAQDWIAAHVPDRSKIIVEAYGPYVDPNRYRVKGVQTFVEVSQRQLDGNQFAVLAQGMYQRYFDEPRKYEREVSQYDAIIRRYCEIATFREAKDETIRIFDLGCKR
jgi:hypothetical protein